MEKNWTADFPGAITVCDICGIVLDMNEKAAEMYMQGGGKELIGKSLFDCHPEPARSKLRRLLQTGDSNVYTIEKQGIRKFICQAPWYQGGERRGMVELAIQIPVDLPHFIREQI